MKVREVLEEMIYMCDGAVKEDGLGFNKVDAKFARDLYSQENWTYKQEKSVYNMLEKYHNPLYLFYYLLILNSTLSIFNYSSNFSGSDISGSYFILRTKTHFC